MKIFERVDIPDDHSYQAFHGHAIPRHGICSKGHTPQALSYQQPSKTIFTQSILGTTTDRGQPMQVLPCKEINSLVAIDRKKSSANRMRYWITVPTGNQRGDKSGLGSVHGVEVLGAVDGVCSASVVCSGLSAGEKLRSAGSAVVGRELGGASREDVVLEEEVAAVPEAAPAFGVEPVLSFDAAAAAAAAVDEETSR